MVSPLFLGVDLGTTRVKVGAYDLQGNQHGSAVVELAPPVRGARAGGTTEVVTTSGARAGGTTEVVTTGGAQAGGEEEAEAWWYSTCRAIRETLRTSHAALVAGVCVGGQGPSLVTLGRDGRAVRPAIMYCDTRAAPEAAQVSALLGRSVSVRSSYLPRALWVANHEPATYAATRCFLQAWDFLVYRLAGTLAATGPLGRYTPWHEADIAAVGLDAGLFPPLVMTGEQVGSVSPAASSETGLPVGVPVIAGGGDFLLATMGADATRKGVAQSQGGTTGAFTLCWDRPLEGDLIGWSIPSPIRPELLNVGGPLNTGGAALDWLLRTVFQRPTSYESALADAARIPPGAGGLLFFPYLAGEQLTLCPEVRGMFFGLDLSIGAGHLIRAVLEGVAFAGRSIMDQLVSAGGRVDEVVTHGGQARSALWNQIKADVWNRPVRTPEVLDAGCLGAAAIAAVGVGAYSTLSEASEAMVHTGCCYRPDPGRVALYRDAHCIYEELYPRTSDLFPRLARSQKLV